MRSPRSTPKPPRDSLAPTPTSADFAAPGSTDRRPEILAPAGSEDSFRAALASGADAVYLGLAEGFNARGRSTEFSLDRLGAWVAEAHRASVKLYLTLNTLVFERELPILAALLERVRESGVDALIVQDPATALLARELCPSVRLHASTQMTISSVEAGHFAATLGVERVVLPRELSAREVALFTAGSALEAEVFVHGALCMSWSGQCLTSEAFSERSANRGQCSQACRMPYEAVVDGRTLDLGDVRYLLSPDDLAAYEALPELLRAGVASLKIEGRYKGPAYVSTAVTSWRNWRDSLVENPAAPDTAGLVRDRTRALLTFSRGPSLGFLGGDDHQRLVQGITPKHRGLLIGSVRALSPRDVTITLEGPNEVPQLLRPGVGIAFEPRGRSHAEHHPDKAPGGPVFAVEFPDANSVLLGFGRPGPDLSEVRVGDSVRLTGDPEIASAVERSLRRAPEGRILVQLSVEGLAGAPLRVRASARFGSRLQFAEATSPQALEPASSGLGLEPTLLEEKLGAFGGTPFRLASLDATGLKAGLHLPVSELKKLRRRLVEQLEAGPGAKAWNAVPSPSSGRNEPPSKSRDELAASPVTAQSALSQLRNKFAAEEFAASAQADSPALIPLCRNEEQLEAVLETLPTGSEIELDWMEMVGLTRAVERVRSRGYRVTLATVRVQKPGEEAYDRRIANLRPDGVLVRHFGAVMHFSGAGERSQDSPRVHGDFSLNVTNSLTARHLLGLGLETLTASHDLNREQLLELLANSPRGRVAVTLHHHVPTFHNSHCVYAHLLSDGADYRSCGRPCEKHRLALRDFAGHEHPVVVDVSCRNTVFNALGQSAAPLVPRLIEQGVRRFRVEFVWEGRAEVHKTLEAYLQLLRGEISPKAALEAASVHERYGLSTPLGPSRRLPLSAPSRA